MLSPLSTKPKVDALLLSVGGHITALTDENTLFTVASCSLCEDSIGKGFVMFIGHVDRLAHL